MTGGLRALERRRRLEVVDRHAADAVLRVARAGENVAEEQDLAWRSK